MGSFLNTANERAREVSDDEPYVNESTQRKTKANGHQGNQKPALGGPMGWLVKSTCQTWLGSRAVTMLARQLGILGEQAANILKNTQHIPSATGTAQYRVPDVLDHTRKVIGDVKTLRS